MINMLEHSTLRSKVENILAGHNVDLVEFSLFFSKGVTVVRCAVDYPCGGITLADCARLNRALRDYFYESGELGEEFSLEVNSPGLKRKLKTYKDFLRVKNKILCLWLDRDIDGRQYYEGELVGLGDNYLVIRKNNDKGDLKIFLANINVGKERIL